MGKWLPKSIHSAYLELHVPFGSLLPLPYSASVSVLSWGSEGCHCQWLRGKDKVVSLVSSVTHLMQGE